MTDDTTDTTDDTTETPDSTSDVDDSGGDATTEASATTATPEPASEPGDDSRSRRDDARSRSRRGGTWANATLRERLQWVALVVLVLVAVATLFSFYTNVSRFISIWATREYEPALQAAFALAVLATSLAGIARLSRNLN